MSPTSALQKVKSKKHGTWERGTHDRCLGVAETQQIFIENLLCAGTDLDAGSQVIVKTKFVYDLHELSLVKQTGM